jgi:hypothetical protein
MMGEEQARPFSQRALQFAYHPAPDDFITQKKYINLVKP